MLYRFSHKTGAYGVTIKEENPKQGDLHNPGQTEGVFFHERRALSHFENVMQRVHVSLMLKK